MPSLDLILEEFRQKATGKDPFGPFADLQQFYESLEKSQRPQFLNYLSSLARDEFWSDYIAMFDQWREDVTHA